MTAQIRDTIMFEGRSLDLASEPLRPWLERKRNRHIRFRRISTALWRGYRSSWEVQRGRLILTRFKAMHPDGSPFEPAELFAHYTDIYYSSVGAHRAGEGDGAYWAFWMTGTTVSPFGPLLSYEHIGYGGVHQFDLLLTFEGGFLVGSRIRENDPAAAEVPDWESELDPC
jgi:hypothetical protein